jgi:hypothetical protein
MTANIVLVLVLDPGVRIFRTGFFQSVMDLTAPQGLLVMGRRGDAYAGGGPDCQEN